MQKPQQQKPQEPVEKSLKAKVDQKQPANPQPVAEKKRDEKFKDKK